MSDTKEVIETEKAPRKRRGRPEMPSRTAERCPHVVHLTVEERDALQTIADAMGKKGTSVSNVLRVGDAYILAHPDAVATAA